ncbi:Protein N-acetyltransferase, RimJ/RimL family [Eubacterium pyruvativorans]|uniref:Protein N-acetyltransferase, RimJ/RimL family n=2 Tax=Eubacterium pyruvativorans TaxID=155865 RepID=A0A1I7EY16_9FIRM|nr:Protein N-acetyltransferase, RimJ/RimL family [Eubacterium pyruvativorans]SFU28811.1 Protein N-acetyltransferase, RimJ/RimL family [Eubacterium pyruvativorans]
MIPVRWGIAGGPDAETGEGMGGTKMIESKNLILRETTFEDCDYFAKWEQDETVTENFIYYRDHSYKEIVTDFVMNNSSESVLQFTIVSKETDRPVGRMVLTNIDRRTDSLDCHMIYIADRRLRGRGLGEEAMRVILQYAFINLHMERITFYHLKQDMPSAQMCLKLGCKDEGVRRHAGKQKGKYLDLYVMSLLRAEYYEKIHEK